MNAQQQRYQKMMSFILTDTCEHGCDYFKIAEINNILYYTPNDETLSSIIAISHDHQLAAATGFYDMDDMECEDSEYAQIVHNDQLKCQFETET